MAATTTPSVSVNHLSGPAMSAVFKSLMESQADYPQIRDLSRREVEVMQAFLSPVSDYDNVSSDLNITKKTLENHLANVFSKLGVDNIKKAVWRFVLIYTEYLPKFLFFYVAPAAEAEYMAA